VLILPAASFPLRIRSLRRHANSFLPIRLFRLRPLANPRAEGITAPLAADLLFIALMWIKAVTRRVG